MVSYRPHTHGINLARFEPGFKLTQVSYRRVNAANPGSTCVKSNPSPEVASIEVEPGLLLKKCRVDANLGRTHLPWRRMAGHY